MNVIIAGGRNFPSSTTHKNWLVNELNNINSPKIICRMARGADIFSKIVGEELELEILEYPANWKQHGKAAEFIRNSEMIAIADLCILFPGGHGAQDTKNKAIKEGIKIIEYKED